MVEAHCRGAGAGFVDVFAELGRRFDFRRDDPARWPDPPAMRAAAAWISARRDEVLATRARLATEQKRLKRAGARARVSPELAALEARVRTHAAARPRVGPWGWRRLREGRA
jgi:hypothetical protein